MICEHLRELYALCEQHQLRLGGSDLIRIVCKQCELDETCPSVIMDHYDSMSPDDEETASDDQPTGSGESPA